MNEHELERLAAAYAAHEELWAPHLDRSAPGRQYVSLRRDDEVDVWAIFWRPDSDTGWHDHDVSSGAVHVVDGMLAEHVLSVRGEDRHRLVGGDATWSFGPDHIHRVTCATPSAVSIHAYSPPLWRLGQYTETQSGVLRRRSVSYAEELRPPEEADAVALGPAA
jgi:predicted metal-dependent enzyme (double-stranded beta helix superfamily)